MTHDGASTAGITPATSVTHKSTFDSGSAKYNSTLTTSSHYHLSTHPSRTIRPLRFFHPTRAEFIRHSASHGEAGVSSSSHWSSRASRKNRYSSNMLQVRRTFEEVEKNQNKSLSPPSLVVVEQRLRHPHTRLKVHVTWDISFWVAAAFVLGSSAWIANGFVLYLPLSPTPVAEHASAAAALAFVGGTLFEIGSYLMYVESLNTGHEELFGEELLGLVEWKSPNLTQKDDTESLKRTIPKHKKDRKFRWVGVGSFRELGFLASFIQLWAATIFWVSTITGLPGVIPNLSTDPPIAIADIFFWTPQVVGGSGFIVSSLFLMLEVQKRWWLPNLRSLGWHIGLWNLIGALGFTMCGALGYAAITSSKANYQSVMSTFWGSFAFMIGSCIQQWEALWRDAGDSDSSPS